MQPRATKAKPFRIAEFTNPSGGIAYRVCGWRGAERIRQNFPTHEQALARLQQLQVEASNLQDSATMALTRLTPKQLAEAEHAATILGATSLVDAANYFVRNFRPDLIKVPLAEAVTRYLADMAARELRPSSISGARGRLKLFQEEVAGTTKGAWELTAEDARLFVFKAGLATPSKVNRRLILSGFVRWCVAQKYMATNILENVKAPKLEVAEPEVLTVPEVRRLLKATAEHEGGRLLPYVVLATFCFIRPAELARLTWDDIQLGSSSTVTIRAAAAKLRARRLVDIPPNAVQWLQPFQLGRTPLVPATFARDWRAIREAAGFDVSLWVPDVLRHSGISYHLAMHEHEGRVAMQAGNSPDVVQQHYKGLVAKTDAISFWNLRPDSAKPAKVSKRRAA
jgi:integrase